MRNYVLHHYSRKQINNFQSQPGHALILAGPTGSGKVSLAERVAEELLEVKTNSFSDYAYGLSISPVENKAIGIDSVRDVEHFLSRRVPSEKVINRVVIIEDSHKLSLEAQNALLKMLEEPPAKSLFILTASSEKLLLPTIRSRAQLISVKPPSYADLEAHFRQEGRKNADIKQAYTVSGGLPGLMQALLEDNEHPLKAATEKARQVLSQSTYERLQSVDELSKQKSLLQDMLFIMQQMARLRLLDASGQSAKQWRRILTNSYQADEELRQNGQPKLVLTKLMLTL